MAERRGKLTILIEAKNLAGKSFLQVKKQAQDTSKSISSGFKRASASLKNAIFSVKGLVVGFAALAALRIGRQLFQIGSAAEEVASKYRTVFGPAVKEVNSFLEENARQMGLTTAEAQDLVATTGAIAQGMGATRQASAEMAIAITQLSADLSSFNDIPVEDTQRRITSALVGERESLKQLGIVVQQADVDQRALLETGKERAAQLTQLEKAEATLTLITEKAGVAVGDLGRTQDSAANTARRVTAAFRQLREDIAKDMLPVFAKLLTTLDENRGALLAIGEASAKAAELVVIAVKTIKGELITADAELAALRLVDDDPEAVKRFLQVRSQSIQQLREELAELEAPQGPNVLGLFTIRDVGERNKQIKELKEEIKGLEKATTAAVTKLVELLRAGDDDDDDDDDEDDEAARLKELTKAGNETAQALDLVAVKADLLGPSFDAQSERTGILKNAINAFTEAGLEADDMIPGLGRTVNSLAIEYSFLTAGIDAANDRQKQFTADQALVASLLASTQTEAERYRQTVLQLTTALDAGTISQDQFADAMQAAFAAFKEAGDDATDDAGDIGAQIGAAFEDSLESSLSGVAATVAGALAGAPAGMSALAGIVTSIMANLARDLGLLTLGIGKAGVALKFLLSNPFLAIAAGVALIALASTIGPSVAGAFSSAGGSLAGGTPVSGATALAGAGINRELVGAGAGEITLIIEGGDLLDMSNPKTERSLAAALEELSGRRVTIIRREG